MAKREKKADININIKNKKIPILTLDARWHELFPERSKTSVIKDLEQRVKELLKKQGKLVNDIKDMKTLKNSLLREILQNMNIGNDIHAKSKEKKMGQNKQFITELNEKIDTAMDELSEIPYQIKEVNEALMLESLKICYGNLEDYHTQLHEITDSIEKMREELKKKIILKQELEENNAKVYSYLHDLLGPEIMEHIDRNTQLNQK